MRQTVARSDCNGPKCTGLPWTFGIICKRRRKLICSRTSWRARLAVAAGKTSPLNTGARLANWLGNGATGHQTIKPVGDLINACLLTRKTKPGRTGHHPKGVSGVPVSGPQSAEPDYQAVRAGLPNGYSANAPIGGPLYTQTMPRHTSMSSWASAKLTARRIAEKSLMCELA